MYTLSLSGQCYFWLKHNCDQTNSESSTTEGRNAGYQSIAAALKHEWWFCRSTFRWEAQEVLTGWFSASISYTFLASRWLMRVQPPLSFLFHCEEWWPKFRLPVLKAAVQAWTKDNGDRQCEKSYLYMAMSWSPQGWWWQLNKSSVRRTRYWRLCVQRVEKRVSFTRGRLGWDTVKSVKPGEHCMIWGISDERCTIVAKTGRCGWRNGGRTFHSVSDEKKTCCTVSDICVSASPSCYNLSGWTNQ